MKEPNGKDLLAILIKLLADQEGVKITYEVEMNCGEGHTDCIGAGASVQ